jgi:large subunit ribosomal protein L7/L12
MKWYFERGSGQEGPVELSDLRAMLSQGELQATHKVWSKELSDWTPAGEVEALTAGLGEETPGSEEPSELEAAMAALSAATTGPDEDREGATGDPSRESGAPDQFDVSLIASGKNKIAIIKAIREITGLGLKEAKSICDDAPSLFIEGATSIDAQKVKARITQEGGTIEITARETPMPEGPSGLDPAFSETAKSSEPGKQFDLILGSDHDDPDDTHEISNAVRDVLDIGLQEAMDLVARAPCVLIEGVSRADAYAIEQHVMEAGGDINWVERSVPLEGGDRRPSARFFAAFDEDLYRDLVEQAKDEDGEESEDGEEEEFSWSGCLIILAIGGACISGCIRMCGG